MEKPTKSHAHQTTIHEIMTVDTWKDFPLTDPGVIRLKKAWYFFYLLMISNLIIEIDVTGPVPKASWSPRLSINDMALIHQTLDQRIPGFDSENKLLDFLNLGLGHQLTGHTVTAGLGLKALQEMLSDPQKPYQAGQVCDLITLSNILA